VCVSNGYDLPCWCFISELAWSAPAHSRVILYLVLTAEEISPRHLGKTRAALTGHTQNW